MQFRMKVAVLFPCFWSSLADMALVQTKAKITSKFNKTDGAPSSTCSRNTGSNSYSACPQSQCYGDSQCCLSTGACTTFVSSVCAKAKECESGSCASSGTSGFPLAASSANPASFHLKTHTDGCTCVKANDNCTSGSCWGTMLCTGDGACRSTGQCTDGVDVANVGEFCMMQADDPACFKFCGAPAPPLTQAPTSVPTLAPTSEPTPAPTPSPTASPTAATTTTTTCSTDADTSSCILHGDPHLIAFDDSEDGPSSLKDPQFSTVGHELSVGSIAFDGHPIYTSVGDYWLIKSDLLGIQARYVPSLEFKTGGAVVGAVAIGGPLLDESILIIEPRNGSLKWDGHALSFGEFHVNLSYGNLDVVNSIKVINAKRPYSQVVINLPMSIDLLINRYDSFLNLKITMPKSDFSKLDVDGVDGQCSNSTGVEEGDTPPEMERIVDGFNVLPELSFFG